MFRMLDTCIFMNQKCESPTLRTCAVHKNSSVAATFAVDRYVGGHFDRVVYESLLFFLGPQFPEKHTPKSMWQRLSLGPFMNHYGLVPIFRGARVVCSITNSRP
jgi:hypothetical protein